MIGPITLDVKQAGKRSAGKPHAAFDVAGVGNVTTAAGLRPIAKAMEVPPAPTVRAPAPDPTDEREQETESGQTGLRRARRKLRPIATGRLPPLRLFSTLLPIARNDLATGDLSEIFLANHVRPRLR